MVHSFSDGWYRILTPDNYPAYVFGADLLPMDFVLDRYFVGITEHGFTYLLSSSDYPGWYQVLRRDGKKVRIKKNYVRVVR